MTDREIRKILVEYLLIQHKTSRIYHEKDLGGTICDIMLVTDRLTGYEIKSDSDNYSRLSKQIQSYDQFFDRNYIVVGLSHLSGIKTRIPSHWGILSVHPCGIQCIRPAGHNRNVKRSLQLRFLWKLELKNLLLKNQLPVYASKSKLFLRETLCREVPIELLGKQIAQELLNRDESIFAPEFPADNIDEGPSFPTEELSDRLSEEDLSLFTLDKWMTIYKQAAERQAQKRAKENQITERHKLQQRSTFQTTFSNIRVTLGVPWISAELISQFVTETLKIKPQRHLIYNPKTKRYSPGTPIPIVQHEPTTGFWYVEKRKNLSSPELTVIYGTKRYNALQILESTLNLRPIRIYDGAVYNESETLAALEKQRILQQSFEQWVQKSEDCRWEIEEAYNRLFRNYNTVTFDGSTLAFPDMNPDIHLFDYQKHAVQKIISTPNALLSFEVGAGKTYIMIAAAMEMRRSGLSAKNLFVVPNNIVGQWEEMFAHLYPNAKILAVTPKSFTPEKRKKVLEQIRIGDYDGIILAYSCFEQIPLSSAYLVKDMHRILDRFQQSLNRMHGTTSPCIQASIKREHDYVHKTLQQLISCTCAATGEITFDQLGINTLFVDEAHNFKNIPLRTAMKHIRGINITGSKKCLELLKKVHFVQQNNGGRGAVFATGTPICNSISDVYAMQCFLQHEELERTGLARFDDWIKTFARPEEVCEIDVDTSGFRMVYRFKEFFNLPELAKMFSQISVFHNINQTHLPTLTGYTDVVIPKSPALDAYMKDLYTRTRAIRSGDISLKKDNMLKVSTDGRKAALSLALVGLEQPFDQQSKLRHCVENIINIYRRHGACSQLVFCDISTPHNSHYSIYDELKTHLIAQGIPANEIAFVHGCRTEEQRLALYNAVNAGTIRVLIGSTFKLGIGANVQTRLKAIHHLDVPWRPADMVQREGRILRRGNQNSTIHIFRYITQGSFDSYSWQILQNKQHFISQFLAGAGLSQSICDFECTELNYAQVKSLALGEPLMKAYFEKETELRRVRIILEQEQAQQTATKAAFDSLQTEIRQLKTRHHSMRKTAQYIRDNLPTLIAATAALVVPLAAPDTHLPSLGKFTLQLLPSPHSVVLTHLGTEYTLRLGQSTGGNKTRIRNFLTKFDARLLALEQELREKEQQANALSQQLAVLSEAPQTIAQLECELADLFAQLSHQSA